MVQLITSTINTSQTANTLVELYYVNVGSNDITLSLPNITTSGIKFTIRRIDSSGTGHLYITAFTGTTINGDQTIELISSQWINIYSDDDNSIWYVMANG